MTNESLDELVRRLTLSQQQLREKCEANIAESKIVEHSRKLIEQSYIILNKAESVKKP